MQSGSRAAGSSFKRPRPPVRRQSARNVLACCAAAVGFFALLRLPPRPRLPAPAGAGPQPPAPARDGPPRPGFGEDAGRSAAAPVVGVVGRTRRPAAGRVLLFVGGLQRSGTTTLANWLAQLLDGASMQDLAHLPPADYDAVVSAVCRWRNKPKSYFRDVLRSGGLEGKFVQNVYPYTYMLKDYGPHGLRRIALNETSSLATPDNAARLMQQWGAFWNASSRIWIEKSPENVVQARFLQGLLEAPRRTTAFLFVLRHPLAWALAVDKWLVNKWNRRSTTAIRATAARIAMWLDVSQTMVDDLPHLRRALVVHAETLVGTASNFPERLAELVGAPPPPAVLMTPFAAYGRSNALYVSCWLRGAKLAKSKRSCVVDAEAPNATAHARRRELAAIRARHEARLNSFGYSLFLGDDAAASPGGDDRTPFGGLNSGLRFDRVQPRLRPYVVSS